MKALIVNCGILIFGTVLLSGCGERISEGESPSCKPRVTHAIVGATVKHTGQRQTEQRSTRHADTNKVAHTSQPALLAKDQKLMDAIREAINCESKDLLLSLDAQVRTSENPDVREAYLDALSFYGTQVLASLAAYLNDPNEDVARTAMSHFESALAEIDDEKIKLAAVESVFKTVDNSELLEFLTGTLNVADEKLAVETIVRIIEFGNKAGSEVAKESYEAVTGEQYTDGSAAAAWLKENYTPSDSE